MNLEEYMWYCADCGEIVEEMDENERECPHCGGFLEYDSSYNEPDSIDMEECYD